MMQVGRDGLRVKVVVEDEAWVLLPLPVELEGTQSKGFAIVTGPSGMMPLLPVRRTYIEDLAASTSLRRHTEV